MWSGCGYVQAMLATHLSIFPQDPQQSSLAFRVRDAVKIARKLRKNHFYHVIKLAENIYKKEMSS